ncbi:MAG: 2-iminoacetate synthase ThiH [Desulfovibrionaceae bacterium]|nr:2-iminoacetate synthase ThiH [Desulfovibrionaceae bacterium]
MRPALSGGFYPELSRLRVEDPLAREAGTREVENCLDRERLTPEDLPALLSPAAESFLEPLARRAQAETLRHFGRSVQLFTPLYLSNYCINRCVYCGFSRRQAISRSRLSLEEVEAEGRAIAATGLRRVLALTGDDPGSSGPEYLAACLRVLSRHFSSLGIEVPSMSVEEYAMQAEAGAESMTMFQETYNPDRYAKLHPGGPKRDFVFRLDAPQRALMGGMRGVNLGPLLGLDDWRRDVYHTARHAEFLLRRYPEAEISISLPRIRPHENGGETSFQPRPVSDKHFVQALAALRCVLPQAGLTLSTREPAWLRDKLLPLGVTRLSAGVCTAVGGHARGKGDSPQFAISDGRSVAEMSAALKARGYQPVFSDWLLPGRGDRELSPGVAQGLRSPGYA